MDKRFALFMVLVAMIFITNQVVYSLFFAPEPPKQAAKVEPGKDDGKQDAGQENAAKKADQEKEGNAEAAPKADPAAQDNPELAKDNQPADAAKVADNQAELNADGPPVKEQWVALGSAENGEYRMLVIARSRGAAIEVLELNSPRYLDLEDRSGYLGYLAPSNAPNQGGAVVHVVGAGTPVAGKLQPDDIITKVGADTITTADEYVAALSKTKPNQAVELTILRDGAQQVVSATTVRRPLAVIRPEFDSKSLQVVEPDHHDPLSFLLTIQQFDDRTLGADDQELGGVDLRSGVWEIVDPDPKKRFENPPPDFKPSSSFVMFRKAVPKLGLMVFKSYHLDKAPAEELKNPDYPAYSLVMDVSIANVGKEKHSVAYRLGGPTGLPLEGAWFANKIARGSSTFDLFATAGLRDVVARFEGGRVTQVPPSEIAKEDFSTKWSNAPLDFAAVDAQYFSAAVLPIKGERNDVWFSEIKPVRVGAVPPEKAFIRLTNVSFQMDSKAKDLEPGGEPLTHSFQVFAGPKRPLLLAQYGPPGATLGDLVYYGWFGFVARPMLAVLHMFHMIVGNYGIAIIMLTVLVRGCMFPVSRKQAQGAAKMQELQPELKKLTEKYKNDPEKRARAQSELFRAHNYHPLSGCLPALIQLPIFVGLYRSLMVDVELRQAPLFGESIRWASNLAAPDMFWNWTGMMPDFITQGPGFFWLGPYLNILPLITISLFIWQQKMFMPPPADEQAAMQQKVMQYMMVFMGIMFFKVASGLCLYFIASSIWGICERLLLPKKPVAKGAIGPGGATDSAPATPPSSNGGNGSPGGKKRQRGRR